MGAHFRPLFWSLLFVFALATPSGAAANTDIPVHRKSRGFRRSLKIAGIQAHDNGDRIERRTHPFAQIFYGMDQKQQSRLGGEIGFRFRWDTSVIARIETVSLLNGSSQVFLSALFDYLLKYDRPWVFALSAGPAVGMGSQTSFGGLARLVLRAYVSRTLAVGIEGGYRAMSSKSDSTAFGSAGLQVEF